MIIEILSHAHFNYFSNMELYHIQWSVAEEPLKVAGTQVHVKKSMDTNCVLPILITNTITTITNTNCVALTL